MKHKIIILAALLTACGTDSNNDSGTPPVTAAGQRTQTADEPARDPLQALAINTMAELPACDATRDRQLVYVMETKQFQTCSAGAWTVIDITGPQGPKGDTGATGAQGPQGPAGSTGTAVEPTPPTARELYVTLLTINAGDEVGDLSEAAQALLSDTATSTVTVNNFCATNAATRYLRTVTDASGYFDMRVDIYQGKVYVASGTDVSGTPKYHESIPCPP